MKLSPEDQAAKVRENRVRRAARRKNWVLTKSPGRNPATAMAVTKFLLSDPVGGEVLMGGWQTLDEIELYLRVVRP
jgi:hypothetical protein